MEAFDLLFGGAAENDSDSRALDPVAVDLGKVQKEWRQPLYLGCDRQVPSIEGSEIIYHLDEAGDDPFGVGVVARDDDIAFYRRVQFPDGFGGDGMEGSNHPDRRR